MWLVDDVAPPSHSAKPRRVLYRLQTTSGWIDGTWSIGALGWADHVWLSTAADGRVVLTAAGKDHWLLALISSQRCGEPGPNPRNLHGAGPGQSAEHGCDHARLSVDGFVRGKGELAAPPQIQYGRVTGAFLVDVQGGRVLDVHFIADLAKLDHGPSELDADFH